MKIAFCSSEVVPFVKTGGLADVAGALPIELKSLGAEIIVLLPLYGSIDYRKFRIKKTPGINDFYVSINGKNHMVGLFECRFPETNVKAYFIDCPEFFQRELIYTNESDEADRFICFSRASLEAIQRLRFEPDIIHCNDWQTGLIPLYLKENYSWDNLFKKTKTLLTIHNIGYQGLFPPEKVKAADINPDYFTPLGPVEWYGQLSFLKTGLMFADYLSTVSETYASEILTEEFGGGMHEILNKRKKELFGILNGVDYKIWNPETDELLVQKYNPDELKGKAENKKSLMENAGLEFDENEPLIGLISRMVSQKGFDLISESIDELLKLKAKYIFLSGGDGKYERFFKNISQTYPDKFKLYTGYNEELAHRIEAGSDIYLMPSMYEPCGLNQIYSLKYGTVPVVRKTGGLADTVIDWGNKKSNAGNKGTGFVFKKFDSKDMMKAVKTAVKTFGDKEAWSKLQQNGMKAEYSWEKSAKKYIELYEKMLS